MELKFDKKAMKNLVEQYYRDYEDFSGEFTSRCSLESIGYGMNEHKDCFVSMKITGKMSMLGQEISMSRDISEKEISDVFTTLLGNQGYNVTSVTLDKGCRSGYEGVGMYEHQVERPYFNGVVVQVKQKQLIK